MSADNETDNELDFVTVAIAHKLLTHDQAEMAQTVLDKEILAGKSPRTLEDVLLAKGILSEKEVWAVDKARTRMAREAQVSKRRIGGYEILGVLGDGGIGVVYKARQLSMGRVIALKVLHDKWVGDDEFRKRFLVEARLVGRLSHQNLIQVFDVGRYKDTLYYSMEYVDGETVEDMIERDGPLDLLKALDIMFQIARALQYLRSRKIVHRDVKPGNIMMTSTGVARLGDFGFVKTSLESVLSSEGEVLGTPDYISPEAAMGDKNLDFRSDLYSLGASFYHMLDGSPPFGGSGSTVMEAHIKKEIPSILKTKPKTPRGAVKLVEKMMAKDPKDRHQSFAELFDEMEQLRLQYSEEGVTEGDKGDRSALGGGTRRIEALVASERSLQTQVRILKFALALNASALVAVLAYIVFFK